MRVLVVQMLGSKASVNATLEMDELDVTSAESKGIVRGDFEWKD